MATRIVTEDELKNAIRVGELLPIYILDESTVVKAGDVVRMAEAKAMLLVREKTTIPVPEVFSAYTDSATGHGYIIMEYVKGDVLRDVWDSYTAEQKADVVGQLRGYCEQLRAIKGTFIGSVDRTACEDQLFTDELGAYGPYENEREFNAGLIKALKNSRETPWTEKVCEMINAVLKGHRIVLTHGDFAPRNILVNGSKVVAILDWELAGFYPEYWEYAKAVWREAWQEGWLKDHAIDQILDPYLAELAVVLHTRDIIW
jgi:aminoglycoside phosphotransferase (APT) family kinase protein